MLAVLALVAGGLLSCGFLVSFDKYDATQSAPLFAVGGTVDGLHGLTMTVRLNGVRATGGLTFWSASAPIGVERLPRARLRNGVTRSA